MIAALVSLSLTPSWRKGRLFLVRVTDGLRLCREGSHTLVGTSEAAPWVDGLGTGDRAGIRAFFASAEPARLLWATLEDQELLGYLREGVRRGDWVVVREGGGEKAAKGTSTAEQRRIVREVETRLRGRISHAGKQYKLIADVDLNKLPGRDDFEVVRHDDAVSVLKAVAGEPGPGNTLAEVLGKAIALLTRDWRPPLSPDGLILLRKVVQLAAAKHEEPPMSPSQLQELRDPTEVEFEESEESDDLEMEAEVEEEDLETELAVEEGDEGEAAGDGDGAEGGGGEGSGGGESEPSPGTEGSEVEE